MKIKQLHLEVQQADKKTTLRLQSLFAMRPWTSADEVKLQAYDVSGVDGVTWDYEPSAFVRHDAGTGIRPAMIRAGLARSGWLVMRIPDRAGNLSLPVRIPFYSDDTEAASQQPPD